MLVPEPWKGSRVSIEEVSKAYKTFKMLGLIFIQLCSYTMETVSFPSLPSSCSRVPSIASYPNVTQERHDIFSIWQYGCMLMVARPYHSLP